MNEKIGRNHFKEFDLIRGIAILVIIAIHSIQLIYPFISLLFSSAVPIFCCLSAILLTLNYKDKLEWKTYYKKRYKYLVPNYLFWMAILVFRNLFSNNWSLRASFSQFVISSVTGSMITLYFMIIIFIFYLFFPFLLKAIKKMGFKYSLLLFLVSISILVSLYIYSINNYVFFLNHELILYSFEVDSVVIEISIARYIFVIFMIPFFILGTIIGLNYDFIKKKLQEKKYIIIISSVYVLSLIILYLFPINDTTFTDGYDSYLNYNTLLFSLIQMIFLLCIFNNYSIRGLDYIGKKATGLYLTHRPVQIIILYLFLLVVNVNIQNLFLGFIFFIILLICCLILIFVIQKLPKNEYIIKS